MTWRFFTDRFVRTLKTLQLARNELASLKSFSFLYQIVWWQTYNVNHRQYLNIDCHDNITVLSFLSVATASFIFIVSSHSFRKWMNRELISRSRFIRDHQAFIITLISSLSFFLQLIASTITRAIFCSSVLSNQSSLTSIVMKSKQDVRTRHLHLIEFVSLFISSFSFFSSFYHFSLQQSSLIKSELFSSSSTRSFHRLRRFQVVIESIHRSDHNWTSSSSVLLWSSSSQSITLKSAFSWEISYEQIINSRISSQ
jgi:hypothetical protein